MWCQVGLGLVCSIGSLLGLVLNGLVSSSHEGTLECVVPIDLTKFARLICAQWGVASRSIWSWGVLGRSVRCNIVGRIWLLTASMWLVIGLVLGPIISSFPLLVFGGRLFGMVLLCEHLSQQSRLSRDRGLNCLH